MTKICSVCGAEIKNPSQSGKCLSCCRKSVQAIFKQYPEFGQAFKETIKELKKPENIRKMSEDTVRFIQTIKEVR